MAERRRSARAMGVRQLTLTGEPVATYMSQKAAAIATSISRNTISSAVNGRRSGAGGFRWVAFELPRERRRRVRDEALRRDAGEYIAHINRHKVEAERTCLMCGRRFMSKGSDNRRCSRCERIVDGYTPAGPYTAHAQVHCLEDQGAIFGERHRPLCRPATRPWIEETNAVYYG